MSRRSLWTVGRTAWKSLLAAGSLQLNCNQEGFNSVCGGGDTRVRIGILGNQEADCLSCDSRIGFGGAGAYCLQNTNYSCGNEAYCTPDNGDKSTPTFGYVMIR